MGKPTMRQPTTRIIQTGSLMQPPLQHIVVKILRRTPRHINLLRPTTKLRGPNTSTSNRTRPTISGGLTKPSTSIHQISQRHSRSKLQMSMVRVLAVESRSRPTTNLTITPATTHLKISASNRSRSVPTPRATIKPTNSEIRGRVTTTRTEPQRRQRLPLITSSKPGRKRTSPNSETRQSRHRTRAVTPVQTTPHIRGALQRAARLLPINLLAASKPQNMGSTNTTIREEPNVGVTQPAVIPTTIRHPITATHQRVAKLVRHRTQNSSRPNPLLLRQRNVGFTTGFRLSPHPHLTSPRQLGHMILTPPTTNTTMGVETNHTAISHGIATTGGQPNLLTSRSLSPSKPVSHTTGLISHPATDVLPLLLHTVKQTRDDPNPRVFQPVLGVNEEVLDFAR